MSSERKLLKNLRPEAICPYDGRVCDGVWVMGVPSCSMIEFGCIVEGGGEHVVFECPRLKRKDIVPK